ncbi:MAG: acetyl-CoA hydrolase/transferase family protein [Bdellovibrionaceae bacterium]|nr:acetyl-CoA hydrolase/transferase family protein [Pseudobdellovibrionaceae bacterium]
MGKVTSAAEAVSAIRSGQKVFVHGAAATPNLLIEALVARATDLRDVELIHLHTEGPAPYANADLKSSFRVLNLFVGANMRRRLDYETNDYLPCFLSEIPALFRKGRQKIDVALLHLSPPDENGFCSLGVSVDVARAAVDSAEVLVAQINSRMPRVHGEGAVHIDDLDAFIEVDEALPELTPAPITPLEAAIGRHAASLIDDGACLQVGIGSIPNAVLDALKNHRHLGVHSEMWSDGILELIRCGAIDNSRKAFRRGQCVSGFLMGTRQVYDFVHDNPGVVQLGADIVNNPQIIATNPRATAINSAVEVDLTGQVCADSIGHRVISGVGGQMDFIRGASLSEGGKPIIALPSRTKHGKPRIVAELQPGAGVVTTRAHTHYVVTEYGVADLYGRSLHERCRALIDIAHPEDREDLRRQWRASHA